MRVENFNELILKISSIRFLKMCNVIYNMDDWLINLVEMKFYLCSFKNFMRSYVVILKIVFFFGENFGGSIFI